jgi:MFS transporter, DHA1 family, inner membrane transport protein
MSFRADQELSVVVCLFLVLFVGVADNQVISPLLPAIREQLGRSPFEVGYLFTGYSISAGISVLFWGPASDLFGRKPGLLAGLFVFMLGSWSSFFAPDFLTLLAGRIVTGSGASLLSLNSISYAADYFPYSTRGWAMGSIFSSYFAALILGVPFGSWLGDRFGWHAVFGASAGASCILLILAAKLLPALKRADSSAVKKISLAGHARVFAGLLTERRPLGGVISSFFASAGTMGFLAFVGVWLHDSFGISGREIGLVFLVSGTAALLASPFAGMLSDRIGKRLQFGIGNIIIALLLILLPHLRWGWALFVLFCLISLAAAFRQGPMEAMLTELVPTTARGSFIALKNAFSQMGIALAALASGLLFERQGYLAVCGLGAVSNLAATAALVWFVRGRSL